MQKKKLNVAIFLDSRKRSGGAYQELLYTLRNIKKANKEDHNFILIATSKKLDLELEKENFETYYFSLNIISRYLAYLRNFNSFIRGIKKFFFFENRFEKFLNKKNIDLVYFVGPSQYALYLENTKFFMNVPDVSVRENLEFPEIVDDLEFQRKDNIFQKSLPRAIAIITNSEIIKKRISFFYRILEERIFVIDHQPSSAVDDFQQINKETQDEVRKKLKLPSNYLFYPAIYLSHKNHLTLIKSLNILQKESNIKNLNLVCCGNDIGYLQILKKFTTQKGLDKNVFFLEFVKDEYLPYLYIDSSILVMPSLIGPTNIPPWEAFKMKRPVIYSALPGIEPVLGDAVCYVDPMEPNEIAKGIKKILEDKLYRDELIYKGTERLREIKNEDKFLNFFKIIRNFEKLKKTWSF